MFFHAKGLVPDILYFVLTDIVAQKYGVEDYCFLYTFNGLRAEERMLRTVNFRVL